MRVLVIGAGVAGSAAAAALARRGAEVTVLEAYADPAGQVGSFLSLAANGLTALGALGPACAPQVRAAGLPVWKQRMWSSRGKRLAEVARNRRPQDPQPSVTLPRAELVAALRAAALEAGARIVTDRRVGAEDLQDGGVAREADLVIGADGMWSPTRTLLDPGARPPRYAGLYSVSGTAPAPAAAAGLDAEPGVFNMVFCRRGVFIHLTAPDGRLWWNAQVSEPQEPPRDALAQTDTSRLARTFADWAPAEALLEHAAIDTRTLMHLLPQTPRRHDERHVLIGDAVHPVGAGQGASMALEDAAVLAHHLVTASSVTPGNDTAGSVAAALAAFDAEREKRLRKMTAAARRNRDAKTMGPVQARMRDVIMPLVFPRAYPAATNWLYDFELPATPEAATLRPASQASDTSDQV